MAKRIKQIADLTPDTANVNRGTERGQNVIDWSLTELGAGRSIVADADGNVLAGNKTMKAAAKLKFPVRVVETDGKELVIVQRTDLRLEGDGPQREKARQLALADNRTQELSYEADIETLLMHAQTVDLGPLYSQDEIDALVASMEPEGLPAPGNGGDDFDTTPEETQTRVKKGDLWQLGKHRLLCGDSTKAEDVARVMGSARAALMNTDPPYGVSYVQKARDMHRLGYGHSQAATDLDIESDEMSGEELTAFLVASLGLGLEYAAEKCAIYVWHPDARRREFMASLDELGVFIHQIVIWLKPGFVLGRCNYHHRFEPSFHGWPKGARPEFFGERNQSNVWEIGRENDKVHPTQKPVELFSIPIRNHTKPGEVIYEPFSGSGSQFIAAEREGRKCYGLESEPKYCNVILSRWEAETGKEAKLLERVDG